MVTQKEHESTRTGVIPVKLSLACPTAFPEKCKEMGWEENYHEFVDSLAFVYDAQSLLQVSEEAESFVSAAVIFMVVCFVGFCNIRLPSST